MGRKERRLENASNLGSSLTMVNAERSVHGSLDCIQNKACLRPAVLKIQSSKQLFEGTLTRVD